MKAIDQFVRSRAEEGTAEYLRLYSLAFERVLRLFEQTEDLATLTTDILDRRSGTREIARYLTAPPVSDDDLKTLSGFGSATGPEYLAEMLKVITSSLDPKRFPWLFDQRARQPTVEEVASAQRWTAGLLAAQRAVTGRRSAAAYRQEQAVESALVGPPLHLTKVKAREIPSPREFLESGEFCRQSKVGGTRADFTIGLHDRLLLIECKASNSEVNSYKRLNHEIGDKAAVWKRSFGESVIPAAILAGVFKVENLEEAQRGGIAIFWEHDFATLLEFVAATR
ncbi:MAG: XamI family restriction endonuclease [Chloroflexota bacterium]|nr:XamI family restriction endonuclease [Chloroflexota bacterium]